MHAIRRLALLIPVLSIVAPVAVLLADPKPVAILKGFDTHVRSIAISPDGKQLAGGAYQAAGNNKFPGKIRIWNLAGELQKEFLATDGSVLGLAFTSDGQRLVAGSEDTTLQIVNVSDGKTDATMSGHQDLVYALAVSPDGSTIASGAYDSTVRFWDSKTGRSRGEWYVNDGDILCVAYSADGRYVAAGGMGSAIRLYDTKSKEEVRQWPAGDVWVTSVDFEPDGSLLAVGDWSKNVRVYKVATGEEAASFPTESIQGNRARFTLDGASLIVAGNRYQSDANLYVFDMRTKKQIFTAELDDGLIWGLSIPPDGLHFAMTQGNDVRLYAIDAAKTKKKSSR